jgi:hypothetical protein
MEPDILTFWVWSVDLAEKMKFKTPTDFMDQLLTAFWKGEYAAEDLYFDENEFVVGQGGEWCPDDRIQERYVPLVGGSDRDPRRALQGMLAACGDESVFLKGGTREPSTWEMTGHVEAKKVLESPQPDPTEPEALSPNELTNFVRLSQQRFDAYSEDGKMLLKCLGIAKRQRMAWESAARKPKKRSRRNTSYAWNAINDKLRGLVGEEGMPGADLPEGRQTKADYHREIIEWYSSTYNGVVIDEEYLKRKLRPIWAEFENGE